ILESWSLIDAMAPASFDPGPVPVHVMSAVKPMMDAGGNYWVIASPGVADTQIGWAVTEEALHAGYDFQFATREPRGDWRLSAYLSLGVRVSGTPVPVPPALLLALSGFAVFGGLAVRSGRRPGHFDSISERS